MNRLYEQTMLFDFYGELLTEHQRRVYEDAVYNDLSLSEIAEEQGISRQGVHDLIRRCDRILRGYEDRLHLVERFTKTRDIVKEIRRLAGGEEESCEGQTGADASEAEKEAAAESEIAAPEVAVEKEAAAETKAAVPEATGEDSAATLARTAKFDTAAEKKKLQRIRALAEELLQEL